MSQPPPIEIQFLVKGLDDVKKALKGIADVGVTSANKSKAAAKATEDEKTKAANKAAREQIAIWKNADNAIRSAKRAG